MVEHAVIKNRLECHVWTIINLIVSLSVALRQISYIESGHESHG